MAERASAPPSTAANAMASEKERYLSSGMGNYLSKPININDLLDTLNAAEEFQERQKTDMKKNDDENC